MCFCGEDCEYFRRFKIGSLKADQLGESNLVSVIIDVHETDACSVGLRIDHLVERHEVKLAVLNRQRDRHRADRRYKRS